MIKTLFLATLKANWKLVLGFSLFMLIYVATSIGMFEPGSVDGLEAMLTMLPEGMVKAFGFDKLTGDLTTYISNYLYGFIFLIFPMIYGVIISNNLISKLVDKGSMAYLLTTPNTRIRIVTTQFVYMISSIVSIFAINVSITLLLCESMYSGMLNIGGFLALNLVTILTTIAISAICFLASCIFNETRISLMFGTSISMLFIVARMVSALGDKLEFLKYFTLHSIIDIDRCLTDGSYVLFSSLILTGVILILYGLSAWIFNKRSLVI